MTAFIGRPVFENHRLDVGGLGSPRPEFGWDVLKASHMVASACTAMFHNGIADCKVAIERMTATQAIRFMRAVAGNVLRDPERQYLSAAFNINTPLVDDRGPSLRVVTERFEVARLGITLAKDGGFDKVTWDGASAEVPSRPITDQLTPAQLVTLVHEAHCAGLETYISAGMRGEHMRPATFSGVDGVGIGTSLHFRDPATGLMGALRPSAIREVLRVRDEAGAHPLGRAARLLARMDRMAFEGSLGRRHVAAWKRLFDALADQDAPGCEAIAREVAEVAAMPEERDMPVREAGHRLLRALHSGEDLLVPERRASVDPVRLRRALEEALGAKDGRALRELL